MTFKLKAMPVHNWKVTRDKMWITLWKVFIYRQKCEKMTRVTVDKKLPCK